MPLESSQAILNASVSASGTRILVGNADATLLRVSALGVNISDVSNSDAGDFLVSAKQGDAGLLLVSAKQGDGALFRVSAVQDGAAALNVSAKSQDAGLFLISAKQGDGALLRVSAVQDGAAALNVSAKSDSAALFRVSSFEGGYTYNNITTSAQTVVKGSAGILGIVALNGTLTSAVRGYDNTVSGGSVLFTIPAGTAATSIRYDVRFATGLVVSSGAAADNLTIMYN